MISSRFSGIIASLTITASLTCFSAPAFAEQSVIANLMDAFASVVHIKSEAGGLYKTPKKAFRDKKTGRILISRNLRKAHYSREGAGVVLDTTGLIVTNAHTVLGASRITVTLEDKTQTHAQIVDLVKKDDIAFLKINPPYPLTPMQFSDSNALRLRSRVFTIGASPLLKGTLSGGQVTGIGRKARGKLQDAQFIDLIQTSFDVYKGDSGGPLLDPQGDFLGLIVATQTRAHHTSYAIPSNVIKNYYYHYLRRHSM